MCYNCDCLSVATQWSIEFWEISLWMRSQFAKEMEDYVIGNKYLFLQEISQNISNLSLCEAYG